MSDGFFRWAPIIVAAVQLLFLPVVVVMLKDQIEKVMMGSKVLDSRIAFALKEHNDNIYSHPALADLKKLEDNIEGLTSEVRDLGIKIERLSPRRRGDRPLDIGE
jgi:hypothetical protein